jgi:hypothetical protein
MMNFRLIAAAALAVALASPAMAMHRDYHRHYGYIHREHAPRFGYGTAYGAYAFDHRHDFAPGNVDDDFARRNTFY